MLKKWYLDYHALPETGSVLLAQSDGCSVWQFRNESGDGTMTTYEVFPGVLLGFNDFHMGWYDSDYTAERELLVIDHCRLGRMEYTAGENTFSYTQAGDMKLDRRKLHSGRFEFPSSHYHGLTVAFDVEVAAVSIPEAVKDFPVTPGKIIKRYELGNYPRIVHGAELLEHIFTELYRVPEKVRIPYFRIKILELLLYLDAMEIPKEEDKRPYFYKTQVEKTRAIRSFLIEHLDETYTQEELSRQFDFALTPMKNCFKSMYGSSIGAWLTAYRMQYAASLLREHKGLSITDAAAQVGYESASKFAAAFKKVMRMTPREYRDSMIGR